MRIWGLIATVGAGLPTVLGAAASPLTSTWNRVNAACRASQRKVIDEALPLIGAKADMLLRPVQ
jgi:hypothetical protein